MCVCVVCDHVCAAAIVSFYPRVREEIQKSAFAATMTESVKIHTTFARISTQLCFSFTKSAIPRAPVDPAANEHACWIHLPPVSFTLFVTEKQEKGKNGNF